MFSNYTIFYDLGIKNIGQSEDEELRNRQDNSVFYS